MMLRFCRLQPGRMNPMAIRIMSGIRGIEEAEFVGKMRHFFSNIQSVRSEIPWDEVFVRMELKRDASKSCRTVAVINVG
jgi:hypothetical protein